MPVRPHVREACERQAVAQSGHLAGGSGHARQAVPAPDVLGCCDEAAEARQRGLAELAGDCAAVQPGMQAAAPEGGWA